MHHEAEAGLFIYDAAAHDAHQRGKAIPRQVGTHVVDISAPSHALI